MKPFGIRPGNIKMDGGLVPKGYRKEAFKDAFTRYLPSPSATPLPAAETQGFSQIPSATSPPLVADRKTLKPAVTLAGSGVADRNPQTAGEWGVKL
ncbi:MAG: DUF3631 domain-containing protein [Rhodospirillaceae bacterium]|nr:DUF3631 domain-containing protein [Rhodospirillaceae bacterium]MBT4701369.1 DUF3631 domain-containing protein [Rhodospirillaceae bacterium]MBT5036197.1 DUF3631 domain-containing protein [Rhodospirillaceae bacterium]MBT6220739.1 DUF3631 domain-containing protein [Rhodospirillaceae bacterium]MBT8003043.1 DUF3631 domain-containing protein [Rhodospirillales bacterium]